MSYNPLLQVCGSFASLSSSLSVATCDVSHVESFSCECASTWSSCRHDVCVPVPVAPPVAPAAPIIAPTPVGCSGNPPTSDFYCVDGVWQTNGSIVQPTIEITGPAAVNGSFSVANLTIVGTTGTITVNGCVAINGSVQVQFSDQDLTQLSQSGSSTKTLISGSGTNCSSSISDVTVQPVAPNGCKKVNAQNQQTGDQQSLTVLFSVDSAKCNIAWIAAVASVGGFVLVTAAIIATVVCCKRNSFQKGKALVVRPDTM